MSKKEDVKSIVETPFGDYSGIEGDSEIEQYINEGGSFDVIESVSPADIVSIISASALFMPAIKTNSVEVSLNTAKMVVEPFNKEVWSEDYPVDKLWVEIRTDNVMVFSGKHLKKYCNVFREGSVTTDSKGKLVFQKPISLQYGVVAENILRQIHDMVVQSEIVTQSIFDSEV